MASKAIFFTVFNRVEYLKKTLNQWENVRGLDQYDIYFRVEHSDVVEEVIEEINRFSNNVNSLVKSIINLEKQGCAHNTWNGFNSLFDQYNFVILAEDDILPSADVAEYFTFLEKKYINDPEVLVISANYELHDYSPYAVSKVDIFRGQIWGTWKNRWNDFIKDSWDFDYSSGQDDGPSGWDWNLTLRVIPKNNLKSVVPHSSRSQHIGEIGLHCDPSIFDETQMKSFKLDRPWKDLVEL
jgi:hypothetical protein